MVWNKKCLIFIMIVLCCGVANATTMCVHSGAYVVTLSRSRDGISSTTDGSGGWTVTFDYNTSSLNTPVVTGTGACNEITGTPNTADASVSTSSSDVGQNCWCAMGMPLISDWVFLKTYASDSACASGCATECANAVETSAIFRTAMFVPVW